MKTILRAHQQDYQILPLALFAMRITPNDSTGTAPFTMVTGTTALTPACLLNPPKTDSQSLQFMKDLATHMETLQFSPTQWHRCEKTYMPDALQTRGKVWVRIDRLRRPLESPCSGPYPVASRKDKYFTIELPNGKLDTISMDRLKPFVESSDSVSSQRNDELQKIGKQQAHKQQEPKESEANAELQNFEKFAKQVPYKSRYGRTVRFSDKNTIKYF